MKIEKVVKLSVGTTAQDVACHGQSFLIQNNSDSATVYLSEKDYDGKAATSSTGYALAPGKGTMFPMEARTLSVVASAASTDVRLLILDC